MRQPHNELEKAWAEFNDLDPAGMVACSSGTAALHLALEAMRDSGTKVLIPDYTMIAVARAVTLAGKKPIMVDCKPNLLMDPDIIESMEYDSKINLHGDCSAIIAVHVYGRVCDMERISRVANDSGSMMIEDLAEGHGIKPYRYTDAACWSFYKNKIVAGEEGGAVWFRDRRHAELARLLRCQGFTEDHDYTHIPRGHNYRLAPCLAEKVLESIELYESNLERRRLLESAYDSFCPTEWRQPTRWAPWVYDLRIPKLTSEMQTRVIQALQNGAGVEARYGFKPVTSQKEYAPRPGTFTDATTEAWTASTEVLSLPLHPGTPPSTPRLAFEVLWAFMQGQGVPQARQTGTPAGN